MKKIILFALIFSYCVSASGQKIVSDQIAPVSGSRTIITELLPIFQMKTIQVAGMATLTQSDSVFTIAFYLKSIPITIEGVDTVKPTCIIVLKDGRRLTGQYRSAGEAMGYKMASYNFNTADFETLSQLDASACHVVIPKWGSSEFSFEKKYQESIKKVCAVILKKVRQN